MAASCYLWSFFRPVGLSYHTLVPRKKVLSRANSEQRGRNISASQQFRAHVRKAFVQLTCGEGGAVRDVRGLPERAVGAAHVVVVPAYDNRHLEQKVEQMWNTAEWSRDYCLGVKAECGV